MRNWSSTDSPKLCYETDLIKEYMGDNVDSISSPIDYNPSESWRELSPLEQAVRDS